MSTRLCSVCGRLIPVDSRLCPNCGARVDTSDLGPGAFSARPRMTRAGTAVFTVIAVLILAFAAYIYTVNRNPTALLVGIVLVLLMFVTLAVLLPRASSPPELPPP